MCSSDLSRTPGLIRALSPCLGLLLDHTHTFHTHTRTTHTPHRAFECFHLADIIAQHTKSAHRKYSRKSRIRSLIFQWSDPRNGQLLPGFTRLTLKPIIICSLSRCFQPSPKRLDVTQLIPEHSELTAPLMAASIDALGMFLLRHCSTMWARFTLKSGLVPPSAPNKTHVWESH